MNNAHLLADLRSQPFYRGQIIRVEELAGGTPETIRAEEVCSNLPNLPSLPSFLRVLGLTSVYRSMLAGLRRAFPQSETETDRDIVLAGAPGRGRFLFVDLAIVLEAVDEGGLCLVVCPGPSERDRCASRLRETITRLDIGYAISMVVPRTATDFAAAFAGDFPQVVVVDAAGLAAILGQEEARATSAGFYDALRRVVLPAIESWPPALASSAALLLRRLHVQCARCGGTLSLLASATPGKDLYDVATRLWGKPLGSGAIVRHEGEERVPLTVVNFGSPLVTDAANPDRWVRQDDRIGAEALLKWLAGTPRGEGRVELHYVVDISGSMSGCLSDVGKAIERDLASRFEGDSALREKDLVKLTKFESQAEPVFRGEVGDDGGAQVRKEFGESINGLSAKGGTDIAAGLGTALRSAMDEQLSELRILLFSDGYSQELAETKAELLQMIRELRSKGVGLRLVYVMLDMQPPVETCNLIEELGGQLVTEAKDALASVDSFGEEEADGKWVVLLAGERGLSEEIVGPASGGLRKVIYTRDLGFLPAQVDPRQVHAIVTSGVFPSRRDLLARLSFFGGRQLPVFILTPAEAHARILCEDWPEAREIESALFLLPENPELVTRMLAPIARGGGLPLRVFDYLHRGAPAYEGMADYYLLKASGTTNRDDVLDGLGEVFHLQLTGGEVTVRTRDHVPLSVAVSLETFSAQILSVSGFGVSGTVDAPTAPIVVHRGADFDWAAEPGQVDEVEVVGEIHVGRSMGDTNIPILQSPRIETVARGSNGPEHGWDDSNVGAFRWTTVEFGTEVIGIRSYRGRNYDLVPTEIRHPTKREVRFRTRGMFWSPAGVDYSHADSASVVSGLANLLRLTLPVVFRNAAKHVLVVPDFNSGIWLIEMAPGGNGATKVFEQQKGLLGTLLKLAGRLALDCPCEGGFAGCSDSTVPTEIDTGCPRCTRNIGPVVDDDGRDRFSGASKRHTLQWLLGHRLLPSSAVDHIDEKSGNGVTDEKRVWLRDQGSRKAFLGLVRRIYADRLGITIDDANLARFEWPTTDEQANAEWVGVYSAAENLIKIKKGMREWQAMDVFAHEFFHCLQFRGSGLLHPSLVEDSIPCGGKLFLEGAAVWAESHFADALAIRTMLELNNLREGDEYGEGFRIMKWIEENHGGIAAVLRFLATGDAATATGGRCRTVAELIRVGMA